MALAFMLRLALVPTVGFKDDIAVFSAWATVLASRGPAHIYDAGVVPNVDYAPGYLYALWAIGTLREALGATGTVAFRVLLKLPDVVADFALGALAFAIARRFLTRGRSLAVAAIVLLAPVAWLDSAYWGQADAIPAALIFGAVLLALQRRFFWSWLALAVALLIKPQGVVVVPLLLVWHAARGGSVAKLAGAALAGTILAYAITLPFTPERAPLAVLRFLFARYAVGVAKAAHGSEGAFNLYTVAGGFYRSDALVALGLPIHTWAIVLVGGSLAAIAAGLVFALRRRIAGPDGERLLLYAVSLSFAALFFFGSRMHERYLLPSVAFGALLVFDGRASALAVAALTVSFAVNCAFILNGFSGGAHHPQTVLVGHAFSLLNLIALAALAETYRRRCVARA
ncbi:MAG: hypothetical protein NVS3B16_14230 [Vulcanimicrobiaceae bacterium]